MPGILRPVDQVIRFLTADDGSEARLCELRQRTAAAQDGQLAEPSRVRLAEPGVESLVHAAVARTTRLYRYDQRGSGLSDRTDTNLSFERQVADLEQIADAAGLDSFALLGLSQGAAVAIEYAVRHPERVSHLVLHGGFARGWASAFARIAARRPRDGRDRTASAGARAPPPTAACSPSCSCRRPMTNRWHGSASCNGARPRRRSRRASWMPREISTCTVGSRWCARPRWSCIRAAMPWCPSTRAAASPRRFPGARFVELDSANHVLVEGEPAWPEIQERGRRVSGLASAMRRGAAPPICRLPARSWPCSRPREREILDLVAERRQQPGNRRAAVHQRENGAQSPHRHLRQDRRELALAGHRVRA